MDSRELSLFRIGAVSYVNALPLLDGLAQQDGVLLELQPPAQIADGLLQGRFDVGLVPSATLLVNTELVPVSSACIASRGAVDSVLLLLAKAPALVCSASLDPESRTSQILARWVLQQRYGVNPKLTERAAQAEPFAAGEDAALVIGDRALLALKQGVPCLDLGAEWFAATGLPFVYAIWAARRDAPRLAAMATLLDCAAVRGMANIAEHAAEAARRLMLSPELCKVYLTNRIRYRLEFEEAQGLGRFLEEARRLDL
ncbi:MAG: hypothetical protein EXS14_02805 [Planctomycetes bacterium]|nr:hypothetical protein [Planctomycetota bacterium]